jgi:hypothetical protein
MRKICARCGKEQFLLSWETKCAACRREEAEEQTVANIQSGEDTSTSGEDNVICPWCGAVYKTNVNYEDWPEVYEEGFHDMVCDACGKPFQLYTNVSYSYDTDRLDDSE